MRFAMAELVEILYNLPAPVMAALLIPPIINIWAICHAALRIFPSGPQERILWVMLAMFIPVLGGIIYLALGMKRSRKPQTL